jgi:hypothetical protein
MTHIKYSLDWDSRSILFSGLHTKTGILVRLNNVPEADMFQGAKYADGGSGRFVKTHATHGSMVLQIPESVLESQQTRQGFFEGVWSRMVRDGIELEDCDARSKIPY